MSSSDDRAASLEELNWEICRPGRLLLFLDDSGTPGQQLGKYLVRDFKLHAALVVRSEAYRIFLNDHRALLSRYPWFDEFHTVEVVGRTGCWKRQSISKRHEFLQIFSGHLRQLAELILYVGIGVEQC